MLSAYASFIVHHTYLFIFILTIISTTLTIIPFICHEYPSFTDPVAGFETRGTTLSQRFIAWENLIEETRPSKSLAVNPTEIEDQKRMNQTYHNRSKFDRTRTGHGGHVKNKERKKKKKVYKNVYDDESLVLNKTLKNIHVHWGYGKNVSYEDENAVFLKDHTRKQWLSIKEMQQHPDMPLSSLPNFSSGMCGSPMGDYAHIVISSNDDSNLLTYENIKYMCQYQSQLVQLGEAMYHDMCQRSTILEDHCCPLWSVPNYIALISGKHSCANLTKHDVELSVTYLQRCAGHFHNFTLMASCDFNRCKVPSYCSQYDAIYNLLFYMMDSKAFSPPDFSNTYVKNVMLFFPLPRSSTVMPYYNLLQDTNLTYHSLTIPAVDFGLKNALFDLWVIRDTWLVGLGGIFVFLCVWFYSKSLILTISLLLAIAYSLGIAYFLYVYVFNINFFPFMNLLVIVIIIGIGADDAFIYIKVWKMICKQLIRANTVGVDGGEITDITSSASETILVQILEETIKHSGLAIFVTTLTTAVAFFASVVSFIPAINCFSIFAGTAVLVNFVLMITWLPAIVLIVDVKLIRFKYKVFKIDVYKHMNEMWVESRTILNRFILVCVTRMHIIFVLFLGAVGIYSIIVVFYSPGLRLPDSREFQLFHTSHIFEQYDLIYRDKFLFEKFARDLGTGSKMPLRWIWGVKAIDNSNHLDPASKGHIVLQDNFTISEPESQLWLLNFCTKLKAQPFFQQTLGPLLPNCFIETFKMFMSRRCIDTIDKQDRTPCCESSVFPYAKEVFEQCIIQAMESLYRTPRALFIPGVAGPKFSRNSSPPKVVAAVIEFESVVPYSMSYTAMHKLYTHVENWTEFELQSAPPGMRDGWFLSDLQFYDLQCTLASGTIIALILSALLGFIVLLPATRNLIISICALSAIVFSSTVTVAILVLMGWKLNILESVAISTSAGLAVDFSLHYALSYTNAVGTKTSRVQHSLSASTGPTAAAALTSGFAGIFLLTSNLLPYSQIGTFLALIMTVTWTYATFYLCSMLFIFGKDLKVSSSKEDRKSGSHISSVCSGVPNLESHELEHLANSNRTNVVHSQSPSSQSATTVVLHEEIENAQSKDELNFILECAVTE